MPLTFDYIEEDTEVSAFMKDWFKINDWDCGDTCQICESGSVEVYDQHFYETHLITYAQLEDPSFDLIHWIHISKSEQFDCMVRKKRDIKWHGPPLVRAQDRSDNRFDSDVMLYLLIKQLRKCIPLMLLTLTHMT